MMTKEMQDSIRFVDEYKKELRNNIIDQMTAADNKIVQFEHMGKRIVLPNLINAFSSKIAELLMQKVAQK